MIEFDTFYKEYQQDKRDLNEKLDNYHREIEPKLNELCQRLTVIETERDTKVKLHDEQIKTGEAKIKRLQSIIGALGGAMGIITALHQLKLW